MEIFEFRGVPPRIMFLTAVTSYAGLAFGAILNWPMWGLVLAVLLPWIPVMTSQMLWTYKHYHWFALLYLAVLGQVGHFLLHAAEMYRFWALGAAAGQADTMFGALQTEWVHFCWNSFLLAAAVILIVRFRRNPWLWVSLAPILWNEIEFGWLLYSYVKNGAISASGGLMLGGLPLSRPVLHFWYNAAVTIPLLVAFGVQLRRTYNGWLAKALPTLSEDLLTSTTNEMQILRFRAGQPVIRQGDPPDCMYVIADGEAVVSRTMEDGTERKLAVLRAGQLFGEIGLLTGRPRIATIVARTNLEVLALGRTSFQRIIEQSDATAQSLWELADIRSAEAVGRGSER